MERRIDLLLDVLVETLEETCKEKGIFLEGYSLTVCRPKSQRQPEIYLMLQHNGGQRKMSGNKVSNFFQQLVGQFNGR